METDNSPLLDQKGVKYVQHVVLSLLYYTRAINNTMLPTLNTFGSEQAKPAKQTEQKYHRLLNYASMYPDASIRYHASDIVLHVESDAAYLVMSKARSRIDGYHQLLDYPTKQGSINGPLHIEMQNNTKCSGFRSRSRNMRSISQCTDHYSNKIYITLSRPSKQTMPQCMASSTTISIFKHPHNGT